MPHKLYIFLEGNDDERFFSHVLFPLLKNKYSDIQVIPYAEEPPKKTKKFIRTVQSSGDDYIFIKDINDAPCVTASKMKVTRRYQVNPDNLIIVVKEIECWYLCGLDDQCCRRLRIDRPFGNTDYMTKEGFDAIIPKGVSRIEFMQQILEKHDVETGKLKNRSFRYFLRKWA